MRIITFFVFLLLAIGFIADIALISPRYALRFTMGGFLLTVLINLVRVERNPHRGPPSTASKVACITALIIGAICFLGPLIMNIKLGIPMRETGLIFEKAPFEVKYGDDIVDVGSETFFINSVFLIILFHGGAFCLCFVAWHETNIESERKKKRDAKYSERKKRKNTV